jgi:hypothetical protein
MGRSSRLLAHGPSAPTLIEAAGNPQADWRLPAASFLCGSAGKPQAKIGLGTDGDPSIASHDSGVMTNTVLATEASDAAHPAIRVMVGAFQPHGRSYAALWREDDDRVRAGKLELGARSLTLEDGKARSRLSLSSFAYRDLVRIEPTHDPRERIKDQPTVILERRGGRTIALAVIEPRVSVHEIAQHLAEALSVTAAA